MIYIGSKRRISKFIIPIMLEEANKKGITTWIEPFVGGGNSIDKVPSTFRRIGIDINPHSIQALIAIRDLVDELPDNVSEDQYKQIKHTEPEPINSWIRFVCSFGGIFEKTYARNKNNSNYAARGVRNARKQSPNIQGVELINGDYSMFNDFKNCLIYCDPPYEGVSSYKTPPFNHSKFWQWCREMSKNNLVFVSEYNAPDDFECVWQGSIKTNFASQRKTATGVAVEKLFKHEPAGSRISRPATHNKARCK